MILEGYPSYKEAVSLHFTSSNLPVTIDMHNRLSYDRQEIKFPFETQWFFPIVRDFLFSKDEKGIQVLDLNGNIHYTGSTLIYDDPVIPGEITDRYKKMISLSDRNALVLLDNRYRVIYAELDSYGFNTRQKINGIIKAGNYSSAYNIMSRLWVTGSQFTQICYDLVDTEMVRAVRGKTMYHTYDAVPVFVDVLPLSNELIVLIDRWGRIVYENKGVVLLMEGTGLLNWPRTEAIDGAAAKDRILFLCKDGTIWEYHFPHFLGEDQKPFGKAPILFIDLNDYLDEAQWVGLEEGDTPEELIALSANGIMLRLDVENEILLQKLEIPSVNKAVFDFDYRKVNSDFKLAFTSESGPAYIYCHKDREVKEVQQTNFGWAIISDIVFASDQNIILLDRYGVVHQFNPILELSEKPYSTIMDALAFRFLPSSKKAIWVRNNGEIRKLKFQ